MIGHLGTRVSALLDGQLSPADEERAWDHVHSCHQCRDAVEREGWVKTRLAAMQLGSSAAPSHLKGSLLVRGLVDWSELSDHAVVGDDSARRRHLGLVGIGSGAVGAAVMGVLALGAAPANAPGAVTGPGGGTLETSFTHAISTIVDRGGSTSGRGHQRRDAPPVGLAQGRTLAP